MSGVSTLTEERRRLRPSTTLWALLLVYLPYLHAFWIHLSSREISVSELMLYPVLIGGTEVVLILLLIRYLFHERAGDLNHRKGRWLTDLGMGALLCILSFGVMILFSVTIGPFLPPQTDQGPQSVETLLRALAESRLLLILWLGPVVWLGVAAFEELSRIFLLDRLWKLWPGTGGRWAAVLISAVVWAFVHIYQGFGGVLAISILGLLYALYYMRFGRVWPLIIAHALFDSLQIAQALAAAS